MLPCRFDCRVVDGKHRLAWPEAPSFGRQTYEFESGTGDYAD